MLWMLLACGGITSDKCNEAYAYFHEVDANGNVAAEEDVGDGATSSDCEDMARGSAIEYTDDAKRACAQYVDTYDTLQQCDDECEWTEGNEHQVCVDDCQTSVEYNYEIGDCEQQCPDDSHTWVCQ